MSTTQIFNDLAVDYQTFRPSYPVKSLTDLRTFATPLPAGSVLDVGAGTGILLRQLCETFGTDLRYVGIEPGCDMLAKGREATPTHLPITFVEATAEAIPLADSSAAIVAVAQALHWFDRPHFYAEATRLLVPGGTLAVFYNQRDPADAFNAAYEDFTARFNARRESEATSAEMRGGLGIVLLRDGTFAREMAEMAVLGPVREIGHRWQRRMSTDEFVGLCRSTVQMQNVIRALGESEALSRLRDLIADHAKGDSDFLVPYVTSMVLAKRQA